jgi:TrmH RNA methyltransferase
VPQIEPQRICGANAVRATFLRRPDQVLRLFFTEARAEFAAPLTRHLARRRAPFRQVPPDELARIAGTEHHGGVVAITAPRLADALPDQLPAILWSAPVLPVLDGIGNPHNLGAILRSAVFLGCRAAIISADARQADLSDAVFRISEGAAEHIALFRTHDLAQVLRRLDGRLTTAAALPTGGVPPEAVPRGKPVALLLGNEETGPSAAAIAACQGGVTLPASGPVESLNVSVAAAVLIHALSQPE